MHLTCLFMFHFCFVFHWTLIGGCPLAKKSKHGRITSESRVVPRGRETPQTHRPHPWASARVGAAEGGPGFPSPPPSVWGPALVPGVLRWEVGARPGGQGTTGDGHWERRDGQRATGSGGWAQGDGQGPTGPGRRGRGIWSEGTARRYRGPGGWTQEDGPTGSGRRGRGPGVGGAGATAGGHLRGRVFVESNQGAYLPAKRAGRGFSTAGGAGDAGRRQAPGPTLNLTHRRAGVPLARPRAQSPTPDSAFRAGTAEGTLERFALHRPSTTADHPLARVGVTSRRRDGAGTGLGPPGRAGREVHSRAEPPRPSRTPGPTAPQQGPEAPAWRDGVGGGGPGARWDSDDGVSNPRGWDWRGSREPRPAAPGRARLRGDVGGEAARRGAGSTGEGMLRREVGVGPRP